MPHTLHVVSHTHWDREWYLTFQQFRMRLVDLIDNVLDLLDRDPDYRYFNLDAQTIVLEDYLAVKPYQRERLERYIREGRITVGPWYQLNDEFLTSGEATVRSLLVGTRIAQQFGASLKIGYLPDQFGNLSQMPQIFRGFGIDNAILGRGYQLVDDRKMEFVWESPDGSQVTASLMAFWYNNAQTFPADPDAALRYTEAIRDRMAPRSAVSHLLLMNGVDHLEAQQDLSPILKAVNPRLPEGTRLIHSTLPQYMDAVKAEVAAKSIALEKHVGELREDRGGAVLAGTLSSRMYLKQANHHAQITLEKYAEPFAAFAMQTGAAYPYDFLHYAWKLLMQNHPHDSICGCSIDQVHREMLPRFQQVEQVGEEIIARALRHLAERICPPPRPLPQEQGRGDSSLNSPSTNSETEENKGMKAPSPAERSEGIQGEGVGGEGLVVFNSLNWARTDPVVATLQFPLGDPTRGNPPRDDSKLVHGFTLTDENDDEIPFAVTNVVQKMRQVLSPVELPLDQWVQEYTIEFVAHDVPACGYKSYLVTPRSTMPIYLPQRDIDSEWPLIFEDCGDVGDEYLHRKPLCDTLYRKSCEGNFRVSANAVRLTTSTDNVWELPESASQDSQCRSKEHLPCKITAHRVYWADVPRAEITITFDNQVKDHRLRLLLDGRHTSWGHHAYSHHGIVIYSSDEQVTAVAEGQFDVIERPITSLEAIDNSGASPFFPQQAWTAITAYSEPRASVEMASTLAANRVNDEFQPSTMESAEGMSDEEYANMPFPDEVEPDNTVEADTSKSPYSTFAVINGGLPEAEIYRPTLDGDYFDKIAVTLLRCVGYLSRRGDGPQFETPDAQCLGEHTFELAVYEHEGDWKQAKVWKQAHQFNTPLRAVQTTVQPGQKRDLPPSLSFVTVEPDTLVVTALKRAEDDANTLIVRFFNITDEPVTSARVSARGAKSAALVNLNEETQESLTLAEDGSVSLAEIRPKQIVTLAFSMN